jgi:nickel transport protein
MKNTIIMAMLAVFISGNIFAHDLWIEEDNGGFKLLYGHKHSSHGGDSIMEYNADFVKNIKCLKKGKVEEIKYEKKYPISFKDDCDAVFILFSSGYWTKTVYGTKNVSKENEKQVVKSWFSIESVKYVKNLSNNYKNPMTDELEIVPLSDLSKIKVGDKLRLKIYYKGKPQKDVVVAYEDKPRGTTDEEGNINISLKKGGFQVITASITEKEDGIKADERITTTNLNFVIKEEK